MRKGKDTRNPRPCSRPARSRCTVFLVETQSWMAKWPHCSSLWGGLLAYRPHQVKSLPSHATTIVDVTGKDWSWRQPSDMTEPNSSTQVWDFDNCSAGGRISLWKFIPSEAMRQQGQELRGGPRPSSDSGGPTPLHLPDPGLLHCKLRGPSSSSRKLSKKL